MTTDPATLPVLSDRLSAASSRQALIAEAQNIQYLPEHWQRDHAARIVKRRLDDFKKR